MPYRFVIICDRAKEGLPDGACADRSESLQATFDNKKETFGDVVDGLSKLGWLVLEDETGVPQNFTFLCPKHADERCA
jgi:hypothetical protein